MSVGVQRDEAARWMVATHALARTISNLAIYVALAALCGRGLFVLAERLERPVCGLAGGLLCLTPTTLIGTQLAAGFALIAPMAMLLAARRSLRGRFDRQAVTSRRLALAALLALAAPAVWFCGAAMGEIARSKLAALGLPSSFATHMALGAMLITVVWVCQNGLRRWSRLFLDEYRDFGPSVKPTLAIVLVLGAALMIAFAIHAARWSEGGPTPPAVSIAALAAVAGLMLIAGWTPVVQRNIVRLRGLDRFLAGTGRVLAPPLYMICGLLSAIDFLLARPIAVAAGARERNIVRRYVVLIAHMGACAALLYLWNDALALVGLVWAFLVAFGLARRWSWVEDDRERYRVVLDDRVGARTQIRIGFDEDLRDEALTAFLLLLVMVLPLALMRADASFALFSETKGPTNWLVYVGGELLKAAPFVDWSEVYGVSTSPSKPSTEGGRHAVFAMRALMDLMLIAAILQSFTISARLGRQRLEFEDPSEPNELLDPFEERALFARVGSQDDWRDAIAMPSYNEMRLRVLVERRRQTYVTVAAARLAGFQLSERALRVLLSTGPLTRAAGSRRFNPRTPMSNREFWALLRREAADGLKRRRDLMGAEAKQALRFQRTIEALEKPSRAPLDVDDELKQIGRRRAIEDLALRMTAPAPAIRKEATDRFQDEASLDDLDSLMDLTASPQRRVVVAAATAIGKVASTGAGAQDATIARARDRLSTLARDGRADVAQAAVAALGNVGGRVEAVLIEVLGSAAPQVRRAAVDALGRLDSAEARTALIDLLTTNRRGLAALAATALSRNPHPDAVEPLLEAVRGRSRQGLEAAEAAIGTLGAYHTPAVRDALHALASDGDEYIAPRALSALYACAPETAVDLARRLLSAGPLALRTRATEIVVRGQDGAAAPALLAIAEDVSAPEELRVRAIEALERIGAQEAVEPLKRLRRTRSGRKSAPRRIRDAARDAAMQLLLRQRESKRGR